MVKLPTITMIEHKPISEITLGMHRGIYHQGKLRVNCYNPFEAYRGNESIGDEIIIYGRQNMNSAFDGDMVAVEPLPQDQWHKEKNISIADEDDEEGGVHFAPSSADDAPRTTNLLLWFFGANAYACWYWKLYFYLICLQSS